MQIVIFILACYMSLESGHKSDTFVPSLAAITLRIRDDWARPEMT